MNITIRRVICAVLALLTIAAAVSCAKPQDDTGTDISTVAAETEEPVETKYSEALVAEDYDGYAFRILGEAMRDYNTVEEANGEVINDAVYGRNQLVNERYNVELTYNIITWGTAREHISKFVTAGDNAYDLLTAAHQYMGPIITDGCLQNWALMEHISFDAPYYVQAANDAFTIGAKTMLLFGDFLESNIRCCWCFAFNKQQAENYTLPDLYDLVDKGDWTVDKLMEVTTGIYTDLDGNGTADDKDFYGFVTDNYAAVDSFSRTLGLIGISKNAENYPIFDFWKESTVDAYALLYKLYFEHSGTYVYNAAFGHIDTMFAGGQAVISPMLIESLQSDAIRSMPDDFGILPYPKRTEDQDMGYIHMDGTFSCMMIPITLPSEDLERTALITEAVNCLGYEMVTPALYEVSLKNKLTRDEDSVRMLDLVLAGRRFSFDSLDESGFMLSPKNALRYPFQKKNEDIASYYAKNEKASQKWLENLIKAYEENN